MSHANDTLILFFDLKMNELAKKARKEKRDLTDVLSSEIARLNQYGEAEVQRIQAQRSGGDPAAIPSVTLHLSSLLASFYQKYLDDNQSGENDYGELVTIRIQEEIESIEVLA